MKFIDLIGQRFEKLIVLKFDKIISKSIYWLCECDCGKIKSIRGSHLKQGKIRSCGCLRKIGNRLKHGHDRKGNQSKTYRAWYHMKERCGNLNCKEYKYYGGRGICVCERWLQFDNFLKDVGEIPKGLTLDRINNEGNYEPNNFRLATMKQQANNRRNSK